MTSTTVRQRVPFQFSEDDELDDHVMDEQEQEDLIENIRKDSAESNTVYFTSLQVVIGLSLLIHIVYLFSSTKRSPIANLVSGSVSEPVPFATALTVLQILIHINLSLNVLPSNHARLQRIPTTGLYLPAVTLPLPLVHPAAFILPVLAPAYALVLGRGLADVLWWAMTGIITAVVSLVIKWIRDEEEEIARLEKLRYTAKGV